MAAFRDGDFYINNANQDFYLREGGQWVRKGNIRDEGSGGLVGVNPVLNVGLSVRAALQRRRYLEAASQLGLSTGVVVTRARFLQAAFGLGLTEASLHLDRSTALQAAMAAGLGVDVAVDVEAGSTHPLAAHPLLGIAMAAGISKAQTVRATAGVGLSMQARFVEWVRIAASMGVGLGLSAALTLAQSSPLGLGEFRTKHFEGSGASSYTADPLTVSPGSAVYVVLAAYKPSGATLPAVSSVSNGGGLTFAQRRAYALGTGGQQMRVATWSAYAAAGATDLVVTANMDATGGTDRAFLAVVEVQGILDPSAVFDPGNPGQSSRVGTAGNLVAGAAVDSDPVLQLSFVYAVDPSTVGTIDVGGQVFNTASPTSKQRAVMNWQVLTGVSGTTPLARYSNTSVNWGAIVVDLFNGEPP